MPAVSERVSQTPTSALSVRVARQRTVCCFAVDGLSLAARRRYRKDICKLAEGCYMLSTKASSQGNASLQYDYQRI